MRTHARRTLAAATTLALAAGLTAAITAPATAATTGTAGATATDEVVIPNPGRERPRFDGMRSADTTGYAHDLEGTGTVWTDYATGKDTPLPVTGINGHSGLHADTDYGSVDHRATVTIHHLGSGTTKAVTLPAGQYFSDAYNGDTVLGFTKDEVTRQMTSATLYQVAEDGSVTSRTIQDLPQAFNSFHAVTQDLRGAVLSAQSYSGADGATNAYYLLDYASATIKPLSGVMTGAFALSDGQVVSAARNRTAPLYSVPRDNPTARPLQTVLPAPAADEGNVHFAVIGDTLLFQRERNSADAPDRPGKAVRAIWLGDGPIAEVLKSAQEGGYFATAPDGSVLVAGGTGPLDWAVQRITVGSDGVPRASRVRELPRVARNIDHLALGGGRLNYLSPNERYQGDVELVDTDTDIDGTPASSAPSTRYRFNATKAPSGLASLGDGNSVVSQGTALLSPTGFTTYRGVYLPVTGSTLVGAAGRYTLAKSGDTTYVGDLEAVEAGEQSVRLTLQNTAAALWDTKVWKSADATGSKVNAYDLKAKTTSASIDLGCRPTDLQATTHWLYWACGADKAGVRDLTKNTDVTVPAGQAVLGDGFVVRHEGDRLKLTDAATGATSDLAGLPASASGSGLGKTWTVDRFGGNVVYLDAAQDFHLKRVGLARQSLTRLDSSVPALRFGTTDARSAIEPVATWSPVWRFSRPVGEWTAWVRKGNGEQVRMFSGTAGTGSAIRVEWDGKDDQGRSLESAQYRWELVATPLDGVGPAQSAWGAFDITGSSLTTSRSTYHPVAPARIMNTIAGVGVRKGKVGPGGTVLLQVAGKGGVPSGDAVTAVVLNVTATNPTATSYVSVSPNETRRTATSNLNFTAGQSIANLVTVPVVNGWVEFYNHSGSVDLLADVAGYYTGDGSGATYAPVAPKRILNTIAGIGAPKAKVGAGRTVTLTIPEPGVTAVAMNVTATNTTSAGYVSVYPYGTARPLVSNLNFTAGKSVPNLVIVPVKDGKVTFYNHSGTVDLLADVTGYFKAGASTSFTGMQPKRILSTISGTGVPKAKVGAGRTVTLEVGTKYSAVVLNVTVTNPTSAGYVSVYPYGTARPPVSNLNFTAGQSVPNLVIVPVKDGKITFYNHSGTVDLLADIAGYYTD